MSRRWFAALLVTALPSLPNVSLLHLSCLSLSELHSKLAAATVSWRLLVSHSSLDSVYTVIEFKSGFRLQNPWCRNISKGAVNITI